MTLTLPYLCFHSVSPERTRCVECSPAWGPQPEALVSAGVVKSQPSCLLTLTPASEFNACLSSSVVEKCSFRLKHVSGPYKFGMQTPPQRVVRWIAVPHQLFMAVLKNKHQAQLAHTQQQNKQKPLEHCQGQPCLLTSLGTTMTSQWPPTLVSSWGGSGLSTDNLPGRLKAHFKEENINLTNTRSSRARCLFTYLGSGARIWVDTWNLEPLLTRCVSLRILFAPLSLGFLIAEGSNAYLVFFGFVWIKWVQ